MFITNSRRFFLLLLCWMQFLYGQSQDSLLPLDGKAVTGTEIRMQNYTDSLNRVQLQKGMENSFRFINEYQKKERKRKQQQMILYIGMGLAMLAVLIYGLRRRQKPPGHL